MRSFLRVTLIIVAVVLFGCDEAPRDRLLFGRYSLHSGCLMYDLRDGTELICIPETVVAVAWDSRYIVVKQHPERDPARTDFYYLEIANDNARVDTVAQVTGPLTEQEFAAKQAELKLPIFR